METSTLKNIELIICDEHQPCNYVHNLSESMTLTTSTNTKSYRCYHGILLLAVYKYSAG
ncbi:MAG: hypothetical protein QW775_04425 [Ignisphaera sp.]